MFPFEVIVKQWYQFGGVPEPLLRRLLALDTMLQKLNPSQRLDNPQVIAAIVLQWQGEQSVAAPSGAERDARQF
jgi:hypothetical protein